MDSEQVNEQQLKKMQEDLKDMQTKYTGLVNDMKGLKAGQAGMQENITVLNGHYEKISGNMEMIMCKLDSISEDAQKNMMGKMMRQKQGVMSRMIKNPLRKLAVGTIGTLMSMGDYAAEKASNAKEGLEDIVAEANYNNKKRRSTRMADEMEPSEA